MTTIPRPRPDLRVRDLANALVIQDPATGQSIHLGHESSAIWVALAAGHRSPEGLVAAVPHLSAGVIRLRLRQLREGLLLDDSLWHRTRPLFTETDSSEAPLPLRLSPGLKHQCVGCGGSCTGVEIGPVPTETLTTIDDHRLFQQVDGAASSADCVRSRPYGDQPALFMERSEGRCVMLTRGNRCAVHQAGTPAAKPGVCQQFPYTFTQGRDAIYVSLLMECRSLLASLQEGERESQESLLAKLRPLSRGPLVHVLPDPIRIAPGIYVSQEDYLQWWSAQEGRSLSEITANAIELVRGETAGDEPDWLVESHWGPTEPVSSSAMISQLLSHIASATALMSQEAAKGGRLVEQEQAELVRKTLLVVAGHVSLSPTEWLDPSGPELLERVASAALAGHDWVRETDLLYGIGRLHLVLELTVAMSRLRAVQAGRVSLTGQDVNDALVISNVVLRIPYVEQVLRVGEVAVRALTSAETGYAAWMGVPHPALLVDESTMMPG